MAKRSQKDRRCRAGRTKYPLRDSGGEWVCGDRRSQPERRLSRIELEWLAMAYESGREPAPVLRPGNPPEG